MRLLTLHRYVQKFYQMRTQLQAISLRIQTVRSNEQMMQSMKGATQLLGSMNRQMNLPALQRIAMEFEKENDIMEQRQEMMDDAIDDVTGVEDEEEGEEVVNQVLDEIGVDLGQSVRLNGNNSRLSMSLTLSSLAKHQLVCRRKLLQRVGLLKLLGVEEAATLTMMRYKLGWTPCGGSGSRVRAVKGMIKVAVVSNMFKGEGGRTTA